MAESMDPMGLVQLKEEFVSGRIRTLDLLVANAYSEPLSCWPRTLESTASRSSSSNMTKPCLPIPYVYNMHTLFCTHTHISPMSRASLVLRPLAVTSVLKVKAWGGGKKGEGGDIYPPPPLRPCSILLKCARARAMTWL